MREVCDLLPSSSRRNHCCSRLARFPRYCFHRGGQWICPRKQLMERNLLAGQTKQPSDRLQLYFVLVHKSIPPSPADYRQSLANLARVCVKSSSAGRRRRKPIHGLSTNLSPETSPVRDGRKRAGRSPEYRRIPRPWLCNPTFTKTGPLTYWNRDTHSEPQHQSWLPKNSC